MENWAIVSTVTLKYMTKQNLPPKYIKITEGLKGQSFAGTEGFPAVLKPSSVNQKYAAKTITEGALLGHLIAEGLSAQMVMPSDGAGQFNILEHALCWVHPERNLQKIHAYNDQQRKGLDQVLELFWIPYQELKSYKGQSGKSKKDKLIARFEAICNWQTDWIALHQNLSKRTPRCTGKPHSSIT